MSGVHDGQTGAMLRPLQISLLGLAVTLVGCASGPEPVAAPARLTPEQAQPVVVERLQASSAGLPPRFELPLEETTPDGLFDAMAMQTFRVNGGLYQDETYAVAEGSVARVGTGLGGPGIVSMQLADADGDGNVDLLYISGSGRGVKTYTVGAVDRPGYEPYDPANPSLTRQAAPIRVRDPQIQYRYPIELRPATNGEGFDLYDQGRDFRLGRLLFRGGRAEFLPANNLPLGVKRRFIQPRL